MSVGSVVVTLLHSSLQLLVICVLYPLINLAKGLFGFMMLLMKYLFTLFIVFIICFFSPLLISALCCFFTEGGSLG